MCFVVLRGDIDDCDCMVLDEYMYVCVLVKDFDAGGVFGKERLSEETWDGNVIFCR